MLFQKRAGGFLVFRLFALFVSVVLLTETRAVLLSGVTLSTVASDAWANNDINVVANARSSVVSFGGYEFVGYYGADRTVRVARRKIGTTGSWLAISTGYTISSSLVADDHCTISLGVDAKGLLHIAFGMHADPLKYIISNRSAIATTPNITSFRSVANFGNAAATTAVTYPEFYRVPGASKDLLFTYRQGASGNGDLYVVRYDANANTFTPQKVIDGTAANVSAYTNNLVYDSQGRLQLSWVWRNDPAYQSNHDIVFARSPDNGATWADINGQAMTSPFTQAGTTPAINIPAGSSLINTTTMAVDSHDNPVIATWFSPGHAQGDETRQYMLEYFQAGQWHSSQITGRSGEALTGDNNVRELGRPLVLVDQQDRTLVLMRYLDATFSNSLMVAYSSDKQNWNFLTLQTDDSGNYEPASFDRDLWASDNKLELLYQQTGSSLTSSPIQLLEWDEKAFFATVPEPATMLAGMLVAGLILPRRRSF